MANFLSKLLGRSEDEAPEMQTQLQPFGQQSRDKSGRQEPPRQLDLQHAEYIPLPPSPPTWEVDGRDEFNREYKDPRLKPVFDAGFKSQHARVLKLAGTLSAEQRQGQVGAVIAKSYRRVIEQRMKATQLLAAARDSVQMFEMVPAEVKDTDRRRFNRILIELEKSGRKNDYTPVDLKGDRSNQPLFAVSEDVDWTIETERKLNADERPDPAFNIASMDKSGTWLLNRNGSGVADPEIKSILLRVDKFGNTVCQRSLSHDVYHVGSDSIGSNIAIMDSTGSLHIYDVALNLVIQKNLREDPRVVDHFRTIDTNYWGELKSQLRVVDVDADGNRYLFTLADEVWCCTSSGQTLWGLVMPLNEGWKRVVGRAEHFGMARDVEEALLLFELSLPVSPAEVKRRYRKLAMIHHPDRNAGSSAAQEKMKSLNGAFEVLTGVDPNTLDFEESDVTYFARTAPDWVIEEGGIKFEATWLGGVPQDWVYAASFGAGNGSTYIGTYSGKVILVSQEGDPVVVYDIGTCPTEIHAIGRYTYFLNRTRLYVVEDMTKLAAFLDVFQQGRLLVAETGFGLLTDKKFQWFTASGTKIGEVSTRDPIRRVYKTSGTVILQTRQHQAEIRGLGL